MFFRHDVNNLRPRPSFIHYAPAFGLEFATMSATPV